MRNGSGLNNHIKRNHVEILRNFEPKEPLSRINQDISRQEPPMVPSLLHDLEELDKKKPDKQEAVEPTSVKEYVPESWEDIENEYVPESSENTIEEEYVRKKITQVFRVPRPPI